MTKFLSREQIIDINRKTILQNGGNSDFAGVVLNKDSFSFLVEMIDEVVYGQPYAPYDVDKAVFYVSKIIRNHIFYDGNKRTGMICAIAFLTINGHTPKNLTDDAIIELALRIADNRVTDEEVREWFLERYPTAGILQ